MLLHSRNITWNKEPLKTSKAQNASLCCQTKVKAYPVFSLPDVVAVSDEGIRADSKVRMEKRETVQRGGEVW